MSKETEKKEIQEAEQRLENVETAINRSEQFLEDHSKSIVIALVAGLAVIALVMLANTLYFKPMKQEAQKESFNAQYYFEMDSFNLALNGDGINKGFLDIIDEYSSTPAGKLAQYYAGVCYLNLGDFENAKKQLKSFSCDDETLNTLALGLIGDAESELGNYNEAISYYKKASDKDNQLASPIFLQKLGIAYDKVGDKQKAVAAFQKIKDDYSNNPISTTADKYIQAIQ